jgi:hypothetical protein
MTGLAAALDLNLLSIPLRLRPGDPAWASTRCVRHRDRSSRVVERQQVLERPEALVEANTQLEVLDRKVALCILASPGCPSAGSPLGGSLILVDGDRAR